MEWEEVSTKEIVTYPNGRYPDQIMEEGGDIEFQNGKTCIQYAK